MLTYECNPTAKFDDDNLPEGLCDSMVSVLHSCLVNVANGWAVGGDEVSITALHLLDRIALS